MTDLLTEPQRVAVATALSLMREEIQPILDRLATLEAALAIQISVLQSRHETSQ